MTLLHQQKPFFMFQSTAFNHQFLQYYPFEIIHVHHDGKGHFVTRISVGGNVKLFDSLNLLPSEDLMKQITVLYSPDIKTVPTVLKAEIRSIQQSSKDCGLFAIVYATEIAYGHDPSSFIFDQSKLRHEGCLDDPRGILNEPLTYDEIARVCSKLKPGVCGFLLDYEHIHYAGPPLWNLLFILYQECFCQFSVPKNIKKGIVLPLFKGKGTKANN